MLTTVAGQTLNILGEIAVNFILNGELIQQEILVVRGKTRPEDLYVWDFCLTHRAVLIQVQEFCKFIKRQSLC